MTGVLLRMHRVPNYSLTGEYEKFGIAEKILRNEKFLRESTEDQFGDGKLLTRCKQLRPTSSEQRSAFVSSDQAGRPFLWCRPV